MNYADAGVSLSRADQAMVGVKKSVRSTFNQGVLGMSETLAGFSP